MNRRICYFWVMSLCASMMLSVGLTGCQPKSNQAQDEVKRIQSKSVTLRPQQSLVCDKQQCTEYHLKTVETNEAWINAYFKQRLKTTIPVAFEPRMQSPKSALQKQAVQSRIDVRFVSQLQQFATFEMIFDHQAGRHQRAMYHREYVNFDLIQKKRIALEDLIKPNQEKALTQALYLQHRSWLIKHHIQQDRFKLSDNFYYAAQGVVFVYPVGELTKGAKEMPELELPYLGMERWIKTKYLPISSQS